MDKGSWRREKVMKHFLINIYDKQWEISGLSHTHIITDQMGACFLRDMTFDVFFFWACIVSMWWYLLI